MTPDKKIVLGLGVNESEFRAPVRLFNELTQAASRFVAEMAKVNAALTKQGGTGVHAVGGGGAAASTVAAQQKSQLGSQGPAAAITRQLMDQKQLFAGLATSSAASLKIVTGALREEAGRQSADIRRLRTEISGLEKEYRGLEDLQRRRIQLADPARPGQVRQELMQAHVDLADAQGQRQQLARSYHMIQAQGGGAGAWGSRWELAKEEAANFGSRGLAMMGVGPGVQALGAPVVIGAMIAKAVVGAVQSGLHESEAQPWDSTRRAGMRQGWSYEAKAMRHGDLTMARTLRLIDKDPAAQRDIAALLSGSGEETLRQQQRGVGAQGVAELPGKFIRGVADTVTAPFRDAEPGKESVWSGGKMNEESWRRTKVAWGAFKQTAFLDPAGAMAAGKRGIGDMTAEQLRDVISYMQQYRQHDPLSYTAVEHLMGNYGETMGNMNAFHMGVGKMDDTGNQANYGARFARELKARGLLGEGLAAMRGIEGIAGVQTAQRHTMRAADAMAGHLFQAPQIIGQAALGGDAGSFFTGVQNLIGRGSGGMDIAAGGALGAFAAGTIGSGAAVTSGMGVLGAISQFVPAGSSAQEMLRANQAMQGYGAIGNVVGGKVDAFQSGTNLLAAIRAAPHASVQAQEYLAQLDPRTMFDVLGGAPLPADLAAHGITADMVRKYSKTVLSRTSDRDIGPTSNQRGELSPMQRQAQAVRKQFGGDFQAYLASTTKGLKGKELDRAREAAFANEGARLQSMGLAQTFSQGVGYARVEAGRSASASGERRAGRGTGRATSGSVQEAENASISGFEGEDERNIEKNTGDLKLDIKRQPRTSKVFNAIGQGGGQGGVGGAAADAAAALQRLAQEIQRQTPSENVHIRQVGPRR